MSDISAAAKTNTLQRAWWKEATIYQVYPSSFCDSNNDGIGDLNGINSKLDYLKDLGIDVVWLSPIYKSPQKDMGYDISDYRDIDPRYGTLDDWDRLAKGLHARGLKLMMDLVVNHTSDQHDWFKKSRSSKADPKRDWYIWRPAKYDEQSNRHPPNNWKSVFQGSAWEWDKATEEYYLHLYLTGQPDLNWENVEVRNAVWDLMRFWLDRGSDGFRMDVINLISKVPGLPDAPISNPCEEFQPAPMYYANGPRVHEYLKEMNREVLSKYDRLITVGEAPFTHDMKALSQYVLPDNHELNMVFQFELMDIDSSGQTRDNPLVPRKWKLTEFKEVINRWQIFLREEGFWNRTFLPLYSVYIQNHDQARCVSRFGNDSNAWRETSAKMLAMLQIAQTGTLYVYQGEEIGMANAPRSWTIEEYEDIATQNYYERIFIERKKDQGCETPDMTDVLDGIQKKARDHARTPMQWNESKNAGFSDVSPWMRVNDDYTKWNVDAQHNDQASVLQFWKKLLKIRKSHDTLVYGDFSLIDDQNEEVFAFKRSLEDRSALVILNFTDRDVEFKLPLAGNGLESPSGQVYILLLSNYVGMHAGTEAEWGSSLRLRGYEGRIYVSATPGKDEQLYISDPLALQSILVKDQDNFEETKVFIENNKIIFGEGLVATVGELHKKQRKMVNPVFSLHRLRSLTPAFYNVAHRLQKSISSVITERKRSKTSGPGNVLPENNIDMAEWLARATLESIGQAGLGYSFDPLDSPSNNPYTRTVRMLIPTMFRIAPLRLLTPFITRLGPPAFRRFLLNFVPIEAVQLLKQMSDQMDRTCKEILHEKRHSGVVDPAGYGFNGKGSSSDTLGDGKDIMSILLRANEAADEKERLSEAELLGQVNVLIFGAQDTTASALSRMIYLLSRPENAALQGRLRDEISCAYETKGGNELDYDELSKMLLLDAVIKETLRLYPPVPFVRRVVRRESSLPLSRPLKLNGDHNAVDSITVPAGTTIWISITGANRSSDVWGADADQWKPERWLSLSENATGVYPERGNFKLPGIYSGMLTFLGGGRSCIGYRFALIEMSKCPSHKALRKEMTYCNTEIILATLLLAFRFTHTEDQIVWNLSQILSPSFTGKNASGDEVERQGMPIGIEVLV
ncbi:hypothetical protein EW145_g1337 [Phellinidium pouzarii]|uniref:Glycosyl hydrolase family 13 catalytic domain-containing protein n=1 Tax=Phellinidium pouzarii TaxID=167371 RepID=A0A4S4LGP6_9AGAM|nr:hypothetical protein EW145_g1337 [Phellinidium pouzarii]